MKVYKKRYNKTMRRPRGVTQGGTRLPSTCLCCRFWKRAPRSPHVLTSTMFVRACVLAGSRVVASQLMNLIITILLQSNLYRYLFSLYISIFSVPICLSILRIYSSNSLKLIFPVAMPSCYVLLPSCQLSWKNNYSMLKDTSYPGLFRCL